MVCAPAVNGHALSDFADKKTCRPGLPVLKIGDIAQAFFNGAGGDRVYIPTYYDADFEK